MTDANAPPKQIAAAAVFNIPELLELILLSLPRSTTHEELTATRFILTSRTTTRTWHDLVNDSTPLGRILYLSNPVSTAASPTTWSQPTAFPPAQPNPWTPFLLLNQRSWGSAYPFDTVPDYSFHPTRPHLWTFTLEVSRSQFSRFPPPGSWREMLVSEPPFAEFWYTRSFYELGSGRAPFVTHLDYDPGLPKAKQRFRRRRREGVTLGMVVDAVGDMFRRDPGARFVMVESLADGGEVGVKELNLDRPTTRTYMPGSSAERAHGWIRGL